VAVRLERDGRIATIVMDRPEALNALSTEQARDLAAVCAELTADAQLSVVLLTSAVPKAFCVGADLKERRDMDTDALLRQRPVLSSAFRGVLGLPMPVIAVVEGFALGGGFELALCCDLIVASAAATVGLPETGIGLVPGGGGTQLVSRRAGSNVAADLVLTARRVPATEAHRLGLVDRLTEPGAARTEADDLGARIATNSPVALRQAKAALRHGFDVGLADGLAIEEQAWTEAVRSPDRVEGIAAFVEKRPPRWTAG